ncbi:hypothetical protein NEOKW01_1080 [Nematocida sp. AWRm80]|nr:hypothetical protein NEOKW01_1080 [Nematocida sp. AWRm80]
MAENSTSSVPSTGSGAGLKNKFKNLSKGKKIACIIAGIVLLAALIGLSVLVAMLIKNKIASSSSGTPLVNTQSKISSSARSAEKPSASERHPSSTTQHEGKDLHKGMHHSPKHHKHSHGIGPSAAPLLGINDIRLVNAKSSLVEKAEEAEKIV